MFLKHAPFCQGSDFNNTSKHLFWNIPLIKKTIKIQLKIIKNKNIQKKTENGNSKIKCNETTPSPEFLFS